MFSSLALFLSSSVFAEESGTFDVRVKAHVQDVDAANNMKEAKSFRFTETVPGSQSYEYSGVPGQELLKALGVQGLEGLRGSSIGCVPYSKEACIAASENLGLRQGGGGYKFEGSYETKGCYKYPSDHITYANMAFYSTGGTVKEMKSTQLKNGQQRVTGYDCSIIPGSQIYTRVRHYSPSSQSHKSTSSSISVSSLIKLIDEANLEQNELIELKNHIGALIEGSGGGENIGKSSTNIKFGKNAKMTAGTVVIGESPGDEIEGLDDLISNSEIGRLIVSGVERPKGSEPSSLPDEKTQNKVEGMPRNQCCGTAVGSIRESGWARYTDALSTCGARSSMWTFLYVSPNSSTPLDINTYRDYCQHASPECKEKVATLWELYKTCESHCNLDQDAYYRTASMANQVCTAPAPAASAAAPAPAASAAEGRCTLEFPFAFDGGNRCCDDKLSRNENNENTCKTNEKECEGPPCMDYDGVSSKCKTLHLHLFGRGPFFGPTRARVDTARKMCFLNDKTKSVEAREVCQKDFGYAQENKVVKDAQGRTKKYVCCKEEMPTKGMGGQENCPDGQFVECTYQGKGGCRNFPSKNKVCERSIKLNKLNKHETCICGLTLCNAEHYECNPTANDGLGMCDDDDESDDEEEE